SDVELGVQQAVRIVDAGQRRLTARLGYQVGEEIVANPQVQGQVLSDPPVGLSETAYLVHFRRVVPVAVGGSHRVRNVIDEVGAGGIGDVHCFRVVAAAAVPPEGEAELPRLLTGVTGVLLVEVVGATLHSIQLLVGVGRSEVAQAGYSAAEGHQLILV